MIVHIGFPKTGTSLFQKRIFPHLEGIKYVNYNASKKFFKELIFEDDLYYEGAEKKAESKQFLDPEKPTLFSFEALVGPAFINSGMNRKTVAIRLKELGTEKVIITIRNQYDAIVSLYKQYLQEGGTLNLSDFLRGPKNHYFGTFNLSFLRYYKLLEWYKTIYGEENILVLLYEDLKHNPEKITRDLKTFLNVSDKIEIPAIMENKSLSLPSLKILKVANHFTHNRFRPSSVISPMITTWKIRVFMETILDPFFRRLTKKNLKLSADDRVLITDYYAKSNKKIVDKYMLPLDQYNYPISKSNPSQDW